MAVKPIDNKSEVGIIPNDWNVQSLGTISSQITDGDHLTPKRDREGYYLLSARNVRDGRIDLSDVDYVGLEEFKRMRLRCAPQPGDILISCSGHGLGRVSIVPPGLQCVLVRSAALVKVRSKIVDSVFIHYWLRSAHAQNQIAVQLSRAAQPNLFINNIERLLVPIPPTKTEQEAIAKVLSGTDALIESLEQLVAKKRQIKHGAMQELLTGKRRLPGFSGAWEVRRFGEIAQPRTERIDPRRSGRCDFCIELEHIEPGTGCLVGSTTTSEGSSIKSVFRENDILFGKLRAYLRKYWRANREGVCSTEIWVLAAKASQVIPDYLFQLVKVDRFIEAASTAYGTHMPRSDWNVVKNHELSLPSSTEQTAIAAILSDMDAEIAALEAKLAKARQIKQGMMQELMTGRIRLV